ncbi:MAG: murein L,D-transpeptidase family protein [Campylobacterota bacterium]|nr:murein L,D-transpeptidase family protein [Campylobacterota bacterium]
MKYFALLLTMVLAIVLVDQYWIKGGDGMETEREEYLSGMAKQKESEVISEELDINNTIISYLSSSHHPVQSQVFDIDNMIITHDANLTLPPPQATLTEQLSRLGAEIGDEIFIRIFKLSFELELWIKTEERYELLQTYTICSQSGYLGPKLREGDLQGPEGFYYVTKGRLNPNSSFHLSFNLGYPNSYDRIHHRTGSALMVHGDCVSIGCYAMTDEKIEEIYELVAQALEQKQRLVRVHIFPFRMIEENMDYYSSHKWYDFWLNLKEGYDHFELYGTPPNVEVVDKRYVFNDKN